MIDLWASASLRTGGDDLAQAFAYLGVRPVWDFGLIASPASKCFRSRFSTGPASTLRCASPACSAIFFETQIALFDMAARKVAALDEDDADNPLAAVRRHGDDLARVFRRCARQLWRGRRDCALDAAWSDRGELGAAYLAGVTHAFDSEGVTGIRRISRSHCCRRCTRASARRPRTRRARRRRRRRFRGWVRGRSGSVGEDTCALPPRYQPPIGAQSPHVGGGGSARGSRPP